MQELTLNRSLDPNSFVRLCRKYKFYSFELGPPQIKKQDNTTKEVCVGGVGREKERESAYTSEGRERERECVCVCVFVCVCLCVCFGFFTCAFARVCACMYVHTHGSKCTCIKAYL